jgi:hypothetical protein
MVSEVYWILSLSRFPAQSMEWSSWFLLQLPSNLVNFAALVILSEWYRTEEKNIPTQFWTARLEKAVFWDVTPCGSCKNLLHQGDKNRWTRNNVSRNQQPTQAAPFHASLSWILINIIQNYNDVLRVYNSLKFSFPCRTYSDKSLRILS